MQFFLCALYAVALSLLASCQDTDLTIVKSAFKNASIPEELNINFNPKVLFQVLFPQPLGPPVRVKAGVQLAINQTTVPPLFGVTQSSPLSDISDVFVIAFVDLDALTLPGENRSLAQIRHFFGGDFVLGDSDRDCHGLSLLSNSTPALSEYLQLRPPAGSVPHRYIFLLFRQPDNFNEQTELDASTPVVRFNISQFALDTGLGDPLGGTFILVGPDPLATSG